MAGLKSNKEIIESLRALVDNHEEAKDSDLIKSMRLLLKYDRDWAMHRLEIFVEANLVWALELNLLINRTESESVGGLGLIPEDE